MGTTSTGTMRKTTRTTRTRLIQTTRPLALMLMLAPFWSAGCLRPVSGPQEARPGRTGPLPVRSLVAGWSVEGRPIDCLVLGDGDEVVLIMASIHGNEPAGTPLVSRLVDHLMEQPATVDGLRVVVIPVANPDGFALGRRQNVNGVDLNRNFPASNYHASDSHGAEALSEPESLALRGLLDTFKPRRIVSLHQPINYGDPCIDYDGPAAGLAHAMAERCDLPVMKLGGRGGSLGSYAGQTLNIPIITVELPREATDWDASMLWDRYGDMLLTALQPPEAVSMGQD